MTRLFEPLEYNARTRGCARAQLATLTTVSVLFVAPVPEGAATTARTEAGAPLESPQIASTTSMLSANEVLTECETFELDQENGEDEEMKSWSAGHFKYRVKSGVGKMKSLFKMMEDCKGQISGQDKRSAGGYLPKSMLPINAERA